MKANAWMAVAASAILVGSVMAAQAQPRGRGGHLRVLKSLRTVQDFEQIKADETVGMVCLQCHSVSEKVIADGEVAMALCTEGEEVTCPQCRKTYKTVLHGPPGKGARLRHVVYVNDDGQQCAFMTRMEAMEEAADAATE